MTHACTAVQPARGPLRRPVAAVVVDEALIWVVCVPTLPLAASRAASSGALAHLMVDLVCDLAAAQGALLETAWHDDHPDVSGWGDVGQRPATVTAHPRQTQHLDPGLVDAAARVVAAYLEDLPDLPLIGEPFGGEEGTD